jgi:uncharacterized membrane protein YczE
MLPLPPLPELPTRLSRLFLGLVLFGIGGGMGLAADLGVSPWHVFHQGASRILGLSIGTIVILTGLGTLILWIPLKQRLGLGTLMNALVIGPVIDITLNLLPEAFESNTVRWAMMLGGIVIIGLGSGFYLGAGLGPGPRDGLMTGLAQRGISIRLARTVVEALALIVGMLLGGTAGIGTLAFVLLIGPIVQFFLRFLEVPHTESSQASSK